jgi:lysine 2,3-aminomutase
MLNTMVPWGRFGDAERMPDTATEFTRLYADPVRRYMLPVFSDRRTDWPSHPYATRDSLHEHDMWVAEGLTHRYPTKVLAELLPPARSTAGTAPGWTWSATPPPGRQAQAGRQAGRPLRRR